jgi:hypothetical protein
MVPMPWFDCDTNSLEEVLSSSRVVTRAAAASLISLGMGFAFIPTAFADDDAPQDPAVQVNAVPMSDNAQPAAVVACGNFAQALDGASTYYGEFSDSFEGSDYNDPAVQSSNEVGRTALRQAAGVGLDAASTPGLDPAMSDPMRAWSANATLLLLKMGLRIPGESLNNTATAMNTNATNAQQACAAAGTHA